MAHNLSETRTKHVLPGRDRRRVMATNGIPSYRDTLRRDPGAALLLLVCVADINVAPLDRWKLEE
jgi:hypothetical protein